MSSGHSARAGDNIKRRNRVNLKFQLRDSGK